MTKFIDLPRLTERHTMLRIALLFPLAMSLFIFGCRSTQVSLQEEGELQGKVYVLGNDPFTKVALALDDRNSVVLLCQSDVEHYLRSHQGERARVSYKGTSQVPEGQAVQVISAEIVQ